jgi:hypothetical protein
MLRYMQAHRHPAPRGTGAIPEADCGRWLAVLAVLTSTGGLAGAIWLAVHMLF